MNWRRGLFRLWVIAAAGWIAFTAWDVYEVTAGDFTQLSWWKVMAWAFGPPAAAGLLMLVAYWVAQGFRKSA